MKVYILIGYEPFEREEIIGVFATREEAKKHLKKNFKVVYDKEFKRWEEWGYGGLFYEIDEYEVIGKRK